MVDSLCVFFSLPNVVLPHDFVLVQGVVTLPVEEVHLLQQLLLVELEFPDHV